MKRLIEEYGQVIMAFLAIVGLVFVIGPLGSQVEDGVKSNVNTMIKGIDSQIPQGGSGGPSYTYDVVSTSESGKQLDRYTVTYGVGTSNLIKPKAIDGYITPQSQMVSWDAEMKTIEFNYDLVDYSLSVDLNGGISASGISTPTNYTVESDAITLPSDLSKGDEAFLGYSGSGLTAAKEDVMIPTGSMGNRSYIANYKKAEYVTISFDSRGGNIVESKQIVKGESLKSLPTVTKLGYDFIGWYNGNDKVSESDVFSTDVQLIAKWKAKQLSRTVIYRSATSGAELKRSTINYNFGQRVTIKSLEFTGYNKPNDHIFTADMNTNDIVIEYTPISYKITYNLNGGGFVNQPGISSYTIESDDITIPEAIRVGYTFTGWSDNKGISLVKAYTIRKGSTGDVVLTANYNINAYRLIFDANGGNCNESYRNYAYGQYLTNLPTPTRDGYNFAGWYSQRDGGILINSNRKMGSENMTIYARWEKIQTDFKIYYHMNLGGNDAVRTQSVKYGQLVYVMGKDTFQQSGYILSHWSTSRNGGNRYDCDNAFTYATRSDMHLYAQWIQGYKVTLNCNPGLGSVTGGGIYAPGAVATLTATPLYTGLFKQWSDGVTSPTRQIIVDRDITLTAEFIDKATITYRIGATAQPSNGGSVSGGGTYKYGSNVTLTAYPAQGYEFKEWRKVDSYGNASYISNNISYQFKALENAEYQAIFTVSAPKEEIYGRTEAWISGNVRPTDKDCLRKNYYTPWKNLEYSIKNPSGYLNLHRIPVAGLASYLVGIYDITGNFALEVMYDDGSTEEIALKSVNTPVNEVNEDVRFELSNNKYITKYRIRMNITNLFDVKTGEVVEKSILQFPEIAAEILIGFVNYDY